MFTVPGPEFQPAPWSQLPLFRGNELQSYSYLTASPPKREKHWGSLGAASDESWKLRIKFQEEHIHSHQRENESINKKHLGLLMTAGYTGLSLFFFLQLELLARITKPQNHKSHNHKTVKSLTGNSLVGKWFFNTIQWDLHAVGQSPNWVHAVDPPSDVARGESTDQRRVNPPLGAGAR